MVKTIGDAVMATFPTPDRALRAAMRMREAMREINQTRGGEDLALNIGLHSGPCLAVMLDDRQDYFGQTVNIASRVNELADPTAILATKPIIESCGRGAGAQRSELPDDAAVLAVARIERSLRDLRGSGTRGRRRGGVSRRRQSVRRSERAPRPRRSARGACRGMTPRKTSPRLPSPFLFVDGAVIFNSSSLNVNRGHSGCERLSCDCERRK